MPKSSCWAKMTSGLELTLLGELQSLSLLVYLSETLEPLGFRENTDLWLFILKNFLQVL